MPPLDISLENILLITVAYWQDNQRLFLWQSLHKELICQVNKPKINSLDTQRRSPPCSLVLIYLIIIELQRPSVTPRASSWQ